MACAKLQNDASPRNYSMVIFSLNRRQLIFLLFLVNFLGQMFGQCNARKGFGALIVGLLCLNSYGFVLSKSKITMCVKDSNMDPYNVVEGKKCEKKLVITKAVSAGEV